MANHTQHAFFIAPCAAKSLNASTNLKIYNQIRTFWGQKRRFGISLESVVCYDAPAQPKICWSNAPLAFGTLL
jgi:hypothetical protein